MQIFRGISCNRDYITSLICFVKVAISELQFTNSADFSTDFLRGPNKNYVVYERFYMGE